MTKDEYREFLKSEIKKLSEMIEDGGFGNPTATAIILCEHNRLVDKLYEFECKTAPVAFKIGDKVIGGDHNDHNRQLT